MAFNIGKFVKRAGKSVANRVLDEVLDRTTSQLTQSTETAAKSLSGSLFNVGASFDSVSAFASKRTDSLVSKNADIYFALAGRDPVRAAAAEIEQLRRGPASEADIYINELNPATKIALAKRSEGIEILNASNV